MGCGQWLRRVRVTALAMFSGVSGIGSVTLRGRPGLRVVRCLFGGSAIVQVTSSLRSVEDYPMGGYRDGANRCGDR